MHFFYFIPLFSSIYLSSFGKYIIISYLFLILYAELEMKNENSEEKETAMSLSLGAIV